MSIIEFLITWAVLIGIFLLGYIARVGLEVYNEPIAFKRIISGPIQGGNLDGRYALEGLDGNIHYVRPPFTLTLD
ncbi:hypothetical protein LCGC14_1109920 [marine sediment metagenome]|uniref:Uncharacterized protein n=1 Tax=marine sediment metagenome TaxID=412755 RepID=A0A0F9QD46_9ZZZZ